MTQRDRLLDHIRRLALQGMGERRTDGQLLEHFISERDEAAFALLLRRHGAMVWSVCRRVLGNAHDADDAFQAAFLVLVRKADSIRPREAVGNWLYGVAYRTALEARKRIARRRAKEQPLQDMPPPESKTEEPSPELGPILDRELSRLSDKYRLPIILCDLEGRSRKEVAQQLSIPEGTLSSRLATARKKLAARLARYGFAVCAASLGTLLTEKTATASLSLSLLSATTKAALSIAAGPVAVAGAVSATVSTLTEGVLKTMFLAKIKTATLIVCSVAALGVGTGGVYYQTRAGAADSPQVDRVVQGNRKSASEPRERDTDRLKRENDELREALAEARIEMEGMKLITTRWKSEARVLAMEVATRKSQLSAERTDQNNLKKALESKEQELNTYKQQLRKLDELTLKKQLVSLEGEKAELQRQYMLRLEKLERERRTLEQNLQRELDALNQRKSELLKRFPAPQQNQRDSPPVAGADKLDQILQRLDRLEKRLDQLEKGKK